MGSETVPKIWIDTAEFYIFTYSTRAHTYGKEVEISESELKILEQASKKFTEAHQILAKLMGTTLEEGHGSPPRVWP